MINVRWPTYPVNAAQSPRGGRCQRQMDEHAERKKGGETNRLLLLCFGVLQRARGFEVLCISD